MPSKRDVLALLSREELLSIVEGFDLDVVDRRKPDDLLEAVASSKKATLAEVLPDLSRERLKEMCVALALDDRGMGKVILIKRLMGSGEENADAPTPAATAKANGTAKAASAQAVDLVPGERLTREKLEG